MTTIAVCEDSNSIINKLLITIYCIHIIYTFIDFISLHDALPSIVDAYALIRVNLTINVFVVPGCVSSDTDAAFIIY